MKTLKQWMCALTATLALVGSAQADVVRNLQLKFESGALFEGDVTFNDDYTRMLNASGLLSGGAYGSVPITWSWWAGRGGDVGDYDGNAATFEDWLMDGSAPNTYQYYIGVSWYVPVVDGDLMLALAPTASLYHAGINSQDAIVSYSFQPVPEPAVLALAGLGLAGVGWQSRRRKA